MASFWRRESGADLGFQKVADCCVKDDKREENGEPCGDLEPGPAKRGRARDEGTGAVLCKENHHQALVFFSLNAEAQGEPPQMK